MIGALPPGSSLPERQTITNYDGGIMDIRRLDGETTHIAPPRSVLPVYATAILLLSMTGTARAQSEPTPATASGANPVLEEVVVTGSRIANTRATSDSPLVAVDAAQIAATGQVSLDAALGQMPQFSASQGMTEVGDVQGSTGFEGGQSYSDLRGLGPQRTLVLLDGQRLVPTNPNGAIELNVIPMALIEGIDVITGGASAVYGSDAMAGVVNFRLRKDLSGIQVGYQHGATPHGDAQEVSGSV